MNTRRVLSIIDKVEYDYCKAPSSYYDKKKIDFRYQSYKRSAINEIKIYLIEHQNEDSIIVIENFRHMVDNFALQSKNENANFMFSVYYDVATNVLDALLDDI